MRNRRRYLVGSSAALLLAIAATGHAAAAPWLAPATLASDAQKPFLMPQSRPDERRERPTDDNDPNRNAYSVPEAPRSPACSLHFCVHWVEQGLDAPDLSDRNGDGVPDFVERVLRVAERVHTVENEKLGWREPRSDGARGGRRGKTDVYLSQIGGELFGYAAPDRGQATKQHRIPRRLHGYLVLDNDYSGFEFPGTKPLADLQVTFAHEYNHILQFGYDAYQDPWFAEATATWMEDQVYNGINDYLRYVRPLGQAVRHSADGKLDQGVRQRGLEPVADPPLRAGDRPQGLGGGDRLKAGWILDRELRTGAARERAAPTSAMTSPASRLRSPSGGPGKGSARAASSRTCRARGTCRWTAAPLTRMLNHTTFAAAAGATAATGAPSFSTCTAPRGTAAAVALVGRLGSEHHGRVAMRLAYRRAGGRLTVRLRRPGRFKRITAVVVNADARASGFNVGSLDWNYLTDGLPFAISGRLVR